MRAARLRGTMASTVPTPNHKRTLLVLLGCSLVFLPLAAQADPSQDFAERERQLVKKAGEVRTLADELRVLDASLDTKTAYITALTKEVGQVRSELTGVNKELAARQADRRAIEAMLAKFVTADYTAARVDAYTIIASERSLSENLANQSYVGSIQDFADELADQLTTVEKQIAARQREAQMRYARLADAERDTARETAELAAVRARKQTLLAETQGREDFYRQQYEASREQLKKMGIFARSARQRIASRVWDDSGGYYNQLDSRWIDAKLGYSDTSTLGDYGCGVAALAMVFRRYGLTLTPPQLNAELKRVRAFSDDLLDWRAVSAASGGRLVLANSPYPLGRDKVDWALIDAQLAANNPVIVYIDRASEINHYVVLTAKRGDAYLMHDPIEGPNLRFNDYYRRDAVFQFISFRPA